MNESVELRTERLLLRRYRQNHLGDLFEFANSPGWGRYLVNVPFPYTRQDAERFLAMFMDTSKWEQQGILSNFAIDLDGKVIGEVYLNQQAYDRQNDRAEIGYSLSSRHWGRGLMTEAAKAVMDWAFQAHGLNRMFASCDPRNVGSWRVMEKLGMKKEGVLRSHVKWNGEFRDQLYYGIMRSEWEVAIRARAQGGS
jgi:RimJ/RimL family protein N-acetyltransferase